MSASKDHPLPERIYYRIAKRALASANELAKARDEGRLQEYDAARLKEEVATCLVFSAISMEAFINQQLERFIQERIISTGPGGDQLRDRMRDDLRKQWIGGLQAVNRWIELPRLLGLPAGTNFESGSGPLQRHKKLVDLRNKRLVHFNPDAETMVGGAMRNPQHSYLLRELEDVAQAESFFNNLEALVTDLHTHTDGWSETFESFSSGGCGTLYTELRVHTFASLPAAGEGGEQRESET